jgi:phenylacetate-CoA ligase
MDPAAILIRRALFPAWVRKNRSARLRYLRDLEETQFLSRDELRSLQWTRFKTVLDHAHRHCAFYRRRLQAHGIEPGDIRTFDDVRSLPVTTKADIQENLEELIAEPYRGRTLLKDMTGGSTGSPMVFYYDEDRRDSRTAAALRHDRWTGWNIGDRIAVLWGAPRDVARQGRWQTRVRDWVIQRSLVLDASRIDESTMAAFSTRLQEYRPRFVLAYANTLALFARFVRDSGTTPMHPQAVICSGEFLTEENRALIESTFGCKVFNRYGSREFSVIASECHVHQGMHVSAENLLVEVVADGNSGPGIEGEIIVTDLRNLAMPMIRYRTMDVGALREGVCACGRGLPLLDLTGGRVTDFLTAMSGARVSGIVMATYGITNIQGVRQVQFVQQRRGAVTARIARGPQWTDESLRTLVERVKGLLGHEMSVEPEFVDHIPLEASGKYRFSVSRLAG